MFLWPARVRSSSVSPNWEDGWMNARGGYGRLRKARPMGGVAYRWWRAPVAFRGALSQWVWRNCKEAGSFTAGASANPAKGRRSEEGVAERSAVAGRS